MIEKETAMTTFYLRQNGYNWELFTDNPEDGPILSNSSLEEVKVKLGEVAEPKDIVIDPYDGNEWCVNDFRDNFVD